VQTASAILLGAITARISDGITKGTRTPGITN